MQIQISLGKDDAHLPLRLTIDKEVLSDVNKLYKKALEEYGLINILRPLTEKKTKTSFIQFFNSLSSKLTF